MADSVPEQQNCCRERIEYWDDQRRRQFGFLNNTLLAIALAASAPVGEAIISRSLATRPVLAFLAFLAVILLGASIVVGLAVALNRLRDFRATAQRVRAKAKQEGQTPGQGSSADIRAIGDFSWFLLYAELAFVGTGLACVFFAILSSAWTQFVSSI